MKTYVFRNTSNGEIILNKKSLDGKTSVAPQGIFEGDESFLVLRPNVRIVSVKESQESEKLILDQPDTITQNGKTETIIQPEVVKEIKKEISDNSGGQVLLNDDALEGVQIING